jgi:poly(3-hydroxybutyrate) depolymerase
MLKKTWLGILAITVVMLNAQTASINLRGKITNQSGGAINKAIVAMVSQGYKDTTGTDGLYSIVKSGLPVVHYLTSSTENIAINNGFLEFNLINTTPVKIDLFDLKGKHLYGEQKFTSKGMYRLNIASAIRTSGIVIVKTAIGSREMVFNYNPVLDGKRIVNSISDKISSNKAILAKMAATLDSLKITADGYVSKTVALSSLDAEVNVTLESTPISSKDTGRSAGCGKTLSSLKSGTYKITSAGLSREYIIDIPTNYDKNKPYKLVFCWHWMGGNMNQVASGTTVPGNGVWAYFGLKKQSNGQAILVAPNGYNGGLWTQQEKDHTFFMDMLKLFKDELCIDTQRVFATGFSFGAMFTYSLAQDHQKQLRAVSCLAAANYNIYLPANTGEPLAYMGVVGMSDDRCPPSAGRACRDQYVKNNGCIKPATVTETTKGSKSHEVYDYQGGKAPVKWCTFDGGHIAAPHDGATNDDGATTWVPVETWKFFSQF